MDTWLSRAIEQEAPTLKSMIKWWEHVTVRYERCADSDKKFIFAMVKCGDLPCTIANVAKNLGKGVSSISTTRAQLINKGIIYPIRYRELDFTVPEFSGFIQRLEEYQKWCEGNE